LGSPVVELLRDFGRALEPSGTRWYLFGAQAAILYGSTRLSADVDVTVDLGAEPADGLVRALAAGGFRLRVPDTGGFVERTRVLPFVHAGTGFPLDVVLAGPGIEEQFFARARTLTVEATPIIVASPEDLIVMKILADRAKDAEDVRAVMRAKRASLDVALIRSTLALLESALDQSDLLPAFEAIWQSETSSR